MPTSSLRALRCLTLVALAACSAGATKAGVRIEPGVVLQQGATYVVFPVTVATGDTLSLGRAAVRATEALRAQMGERGLRVAPDTIGAAGAIHVRASLLSYSSGNTTHATLGAILGAATGVAGAGGGLGTPRCVMRAALHSADGRLLAEMISTQDGLGGTLSALDKCTYAVADAIATRVASR